MRPVPVSSLLLACCYTTQVVHAARRDGHRSAPKALTGVPRSNEDLVRPSTVLSGSDCLSRSREGARSSVVNEGLFRGGNGRPPALVKSIIYTQ